MPSWTISTTTTAIPSPTSGPRLPPKSSVKSPVRNKRWNHNTSGQDAADAARGPVAHRACDRLFRRAAMAFRDGEDSPTRAGAQHHGAEISGRLAAGANAIPVGKPEAGLVRPPRPEALLCLKTGHKAGLARAERGAAGHVLGLLLRNR